MRECKVKGHRNKEVTRVCTYRVCDFESRWACNQCFEEQIHSHKNGTLPYLIDIFEYNDYLKQTQPVEVTTLKNQLIVAEKLVNEIQLIYDSIKEIIKCQESHQQFLDKHENILSLDKQSLDREIKLGTAYKTYNEINNHILSSQIQLQNLIFKDHNYDIVPIQASISQVMKLPKISENEKYLGFQEQDKYNLNIIAMPSNKCFYSKYIGPPDAYITFSNDSRFVLNCADNKIYIFLTKGLKLTSKKKLQLQGSPKFFKWIKEDEFITADREGLKIYTMKNKKMSLIIQGQYYIFEYDSFNKLIATVNYDHQIQFYNREDGKPFQILWNQAIDRAYKILFIDKGQALITQHQEFFDKWQVDLQGKKLLIVQTIDTGYWPFGKFWFDQMIITIKDNSIRITDFNLNTKYTFFFQDELESAVKSKNYLIVKLVGGFQIILKNQIKNI